MALIAITLIGTQIPNEIKLLFLLCFKKVVDYYWRNNTNECKVNIKHLSFPKNGN